MINNVVLCGRLTAAPELKTTNNGQSVTAFTIAVERRFLKDGERQTDFINCVAWRNTAEFISKHFIKGDPIAVTGEIQTRKYQDKNGNSRVAVEVVIDNARFVPSKSNGNSGTTEDSAPPVNNNFTDAGDIDDDLPF
jgi:single-strand DNA-binding protein